MFQQLNLEAFKCFQRLSIKLEPLTVLSGANASGKSTIIQALALLHQTVVDHEWSSTLLLNGSSVALGTVEDVIDQEPTEADYQARDSFAIGIVTDDGDALWAAGGIDVREARSAPLLSVKFRSSTTGEYASQPLRLSPSDITEVPLTRLFPETLVVQFPTAIHNIQTQLRGLQYISSERIGPRETYERAPDFSERLVGKRGEYTASYLVSYGGDFANAGMLLGEQTGFTIRDQTNAWMQYFFPGADVKVDSIEGTSLVKLRIRTRQSGDHHLPQNVGFGLTHLLPIIVGCIGTKPGDTIIIENPETHLHPRGQSEIGMFIARLAESGVQVVLETHSDHVLNGIRKRVGSGSLSSHKVAIYFVSARDSLGAIADEERVQRLRMEENGRIIDWPQGFFDQLENDLDEIFSNT